MMKTSSAPVLVAALLSLTLSACQQREERHEHVHHRVTATVPMAKDVAVDEEYVCQIHSSRHIEVRALEEGFLEEIKVKEGQTVKRGETLYQLLPVLYQARLDSERAEAHYAQMELNNTKKLFQDKVVSEKEVALLEAKLARAQAKVKQAEAELSFTTLKAPFDGIVDHQYHQQGSLIEAGDILTTLSDNSTMWVYFNVPEARYLAYMAGGERKNEDLRVGLRLADGNEFREAGKIGAIEADFNNQTGNIAFRADFPNPDRLLRHGQTGTIVLREVLKDAVVIPQRATFEILAKTYVFVLEPESEGRESEAGPKDIARHDVKVEMPRSDGRVPTVREGGDHRDHEHDDHDEDEHEDHDDHEIADDDHGPHDAHDAHDAHGGLRGVVRQREIVVLKELDDVYVVKDGVGLNDKIILEGVRQVRDGERVTYEFVAPEKALENLKYHAE